MDWDCTFCKKIATDIGGETERIGNCFIFEPLNPVVPGHLLVIHKEHTSDFSENPEVSQEVMRVAAYASKRYPECNIITSKGRNATQSVFHLHVHIVPRKEKDGLKLPWTGQLPQPEGVKDDK